jgi:hypothetical protein
MPSKGIDIMVSVMISEACDFLTHCETFASLRIDSPTWHYLYVIE